MPVVNLSKAIFQHVDVIVKLLASTKTFSRDAKKGDRNRSFQLVCATLDILRFGLVSQNPAVALWAVRTLTQLVSHFEAMEKSPHRSPRWPRHFPCAGLRHWKACSNSRVPCQPSENL